MADTPWIWDEDEKEWELDGTPGRVWRSFAETKPFWADYGSRPLGRYPTEQAAKEAVEKSAIADGF